MDVQDALCTRCREVTPQVIRDYYDHTEIVCSLCGRTTEFSMKDDLVKITWVKED